MNALVGDIGGTKTILAVFSNETGPHKALAEKTFPSTHYQTFEVMVAEFLNEVNPPVDCACFGVAGPVIGNKAQITNLIWAVDGAVLQSIYHWSAVALLNDMESIAYAIPILGQGDIHTLNAVIPVKGGAIGVLAPGTGLGEGFLTYDNGVYHARPSEGSHASFAPMNPRRLAY